MRGISPVVKNLIIINVIFWVASIVLLNTFGLELDNYLGLHYYKSEDFNIAQLITYMFLHSYHNFSVWHILFNMYGLYLFGVMLEQVWGSKRFFQYYIITGVGAALIQMLVYHIRIKSLESGLDPELISYVYQQGLSHFENGRYIPMGVELMDQLNLMINTTTVGASGAVFGILLAFGMLFPNTQFMLLFPPIPVKAKYLVIGYGVLELYLGFANRAGDNVAHFAHLGGMLFGFFLIKYWNKHTKHFY